MKPFCETPVTPCIDIKNAGKPRHFNVERDAALHMLTGLPDAVAHGEGFVESLSKCTNNGQSVVPRGDVGSTWVNGTGSAGKAARDLAVH